MSESIDEAWAAAEQALPAGAVIVRIQRVMTGAWGSGTQNRWDPPGEWEIEVWGPEREDGDADRLLVEVRGPTLPAALRAVAEWVRRNDA